MFASNFHDLKTHCERFLQEIRDNTRPLRSCLFECTKCRGCTLLCLCPDLQISLQQTLLYCLLRSNWDHNWINQHHAVLKNTWNQQSAVDHKLIRETVDCGNTSSEKSGSCELTLNQNSSFNNQLSLPLLASRKKAGFRHFCIVFTFHSFNTTSTSFFKVSYLRWGLRLLFTMCDDFVVEMPTGFLNNKMHFYPRDRWCRCIMLCPKKRTATVRSLTCQWRLSQVNCFVVLSIGFGQLCEGFLLSVQSFFQVFFHGKRFCAHVIFCSCRENRWWWEDIQAENIGFVSTSKKSHGQKWH